MAMIVFAGPSLGAAPETDGRIVFRPPAACGDLLRACGERPEAIGLIDGYFETRPSVWHKEILWALRQGVAVYGAASMGALRAAECAAFGMIGLGQVFALYRDGVIDRDDEVAVQHGPPETNYVLLSEALVNIRATLARAVAAGVLEQGGADGLLACAADLFYKERTWEAACAAWQAQGAEPVRAAAFLQWLPQHKVDVKRADALQLVAALLAHKGVDRPPAPAFDFAHTQFWEILRRRVGASDSA
ncbi:TfuA-like protein [Methylovirgula sp. 4M-Z18]|uniref:TfuA-like protein n=1 Tax=Methylovirgula sp. 4M-Z18 TaxID=2293567 RepID=UPI001314CE6A|nr:TfuA-like protein [Methylovirgula sp. 4M-Z18]